MGALPPDFDLFGVAIAAGHAPAPDPETGNPVIACPECASEAVLGPEWVLCHGGCQKLSTARFCASNGISLPDPSAASAATPGERQRPQRVAEIELEDFRDWYEARDPRPFRATELAVFLGFPADKAKGRGARLGARLLRIGFERWRAGRGHAWQYAFPGDWPKTNRRMGRKNPPQCPCCNAFMQERMAKHAPRMHEAMKVGLKILGEVKEDPSND